MKKEKILLFFIVGVLFSLSGCLSSSANPEDIAAFKKPDEVNVTADKYVLQPADRVEIQASKIPELHLQEQQIRPDGKVTFESLGGVEAAGKTPEELAELIYDKISQLYAITGQHPVDVRVTEYRSKAYFVLGQVYHPGRKESTGRETILDAISEARLNTLAWKKRIQIVRPSADPDVRPKIFEFNHDKLVVHGDASQNVLLENGDIIYVPPTPLGAVGLTLEQLLSPIGRAFSTVNIVQGAPARRN